jgi:hypothetical protein
MQGTINKQEILKRVKAMIMSSEKRPKYMAISPVKTAAVLRVEPFMIEECLEEFVQEGVLIQRQMEEPPYKTVYSINENKETITNK